MLTNQECQKRVHSGKICGASVCHAQRRSRSKPAVWRCEESWPHFSPTALCWGSGPQQTAFVAWRAGKRLNKNPSFLSMKHAKLPPGGYGLFWKRFDVYFKFSLILSSYFSLASALFHFSFQALFSTILLSLCLPTLTVLTRSRALVRVFVCPGCLWFIVSAFRSKLWSLEYKWDRLIELHRHFA